LMLVAFSIGFNTVRYPVVWEMVNPARASESVQPAAASQPEKPESPTPAPPPSNPAKPIAVQPAPEATDKTVIGNAQSAESNSASGDAATASEEAAAAEREVRKPLVPVTPVSAPNALRNEAAGGAGIRRLPPVARANANPVNRDPTRPFDGSIPVYPTTGIE
jgi:hypothetical protein